MVRPFIYFHTSCVRTAKALARLYGCAGSLQPSLVACDKYHKYHNLMSWLNELKHLNLVIFDFIHLTVFCSNKCPLYIYFLTRLAKNAKKMLANCQQNGLSSTQQCRIFAQILFQEIHFKDSYITMPLGCLLEY